MIPDVCSTVNFGYNPIFFSTEIDDKEKKDVLEILSVLGKCPEVSEDKLEAYAILTAMGPTYLWFQLYEMEKIGRAFGLPSQEIKKGIFPTAVGTVNTLYDSTLLLEEVMDLIPVNSLREEEENIRNIYHAKLQALYKKLKDSFKPKQHHEEGGLK
jgi:pyrroline-5-carboxylate reductase